MWRELARFDDPALASAVATTIAAMEFDVRLEERGVVEVAECDRADLVDVLEEIIAEQQDFDRDIQERQRRSQRQAGVILLVATGAVDVMTLLRLLDP